MNKKNLNLIFSFFNLLPFYPFTFWILKLTIAWCNWPNNFTRSKSVWARRQLKRRRVIMKRGAYCVVMGMGPTVKSAVHLYEIPVPPHLHVSKQTPLQANGQFSPFIYLPSSFSLLPLLRFFIFYNMLIIILTFHCFYILLFYPFFIFTVSLIIL